MRTFLDSIYLAQEKQFDMLYKPMNTEYHSSGVINNDNTFETFARLENRVDLREKSKSTSKFGTATFIRTVS